VFPQTQLIIVPVQIYPVHTHPHAPLFKTHFNIILNIWLRFKIGLFLADIPTNVVLANILHFR
jgi:hypothetical protein